MATHVHSTNYIMAVIGTNPFTEGFHEWEIEVNQLSGNNHIYFGINDISTNPVFPQKLFLP